jgi:hypothetical protein
MTVRPLESGEVSARAVVLLGLNAETTDVVTPEALAAALRRAASFLCPATPAQLVAAVRDTLSPLPEARELTRDDLMDMIESLISTGDLLELRQSGERTGRLIFLGPPSFVTKVPGEYLIFGVRPEGRPLIDDERATIEYEAHLRVLRLLPDIAHEVLAATGLHELRRNRWLRHPQRAVAAQVVAEYRTRLAASRPSGTVDGLELLDPAKVVRFYRGRWRPASPDDTGDFVARRPQAYGANAWCFVQIENGRPRHLIDLPVHDFGALGRDEAWRLQAAIDAERGTPQLWHRRRLPGSEAAYVLDLYGPVPSWAERHLGVLGTPLDRSRGALFSYRLEGAAIEAAEGVLTDMLWMQRLDEEGAEE